MNRVAPTILALLICACSLHCGGGGGSSTVGGPIIPPPTGAPTIESDDVCLAGNAVRIQPGDVNGSMFEIDIMVTADVADFYGAGFGIMFSGATFVGIDATEASFLDGLPSDIQADLQQPNIVEVVATMTAQQAGINQSATVPLVTLVFNATADGDLDFLGASERDVRVCDTATSCQSQAGVCWDNATLTLM